MQYGNSLSSLCNPVYIAVRVLYTQIHAKKDSGRLSCIVIFIFLNSIDLHSYITSHGNNIVRANLKAVNDYEIPDRTEMLLLHMFKGLLEDKVLCLLHQALLVAG